VLRFRKWWGRGARAAVLVKVVPRSHANGLPLWFGATTDQPASPGRPHRARHSGYHGVDIRLRSIASWPGMPALGCDATVPSAAGSAHLQNDVTALENGAQLAELAAGLPDEPGAVAIGRKVI
jgi:hypothetical protein